MDASVQVVSQNQPPVQYLQHLGVRVPITVLSADLDNRNAWADRLDKRSAAAVPAAVVSYLEQLRRQRLASAQQPLLTGLPRIARKQRCEIAVYQPQNQ